MPAATALHVPPALDTVFKGHGSHPVLAALEDMPAGQGKQSWPAKEYLPAGHCEQDDAPAFAYLPAGHREQATLTPVAGVIEFLGHAKHCVSG